MKIHDQCPFTSKIVITDIYGYAEAATKEDSRDLYEGIIRGENIRTGGVATCIAGGAGNAQEGCLFHYCIPERKELDDIYQNFKELKSIDEKTGAFITGGWGSFGLPTISKKYFDIVMDRIKEFKDRTTIIWGQKDMGGTNVHYSNEGDGVWTICHFGDKINSLEDLKKVYEIIQIADSDELWIGGKKIDTKKTT